MNIIETSLTGVLLIEPKVFGDHRGYFMESYNQKSFLEKGLGIQFVQDNHSLSVPAGTLRGLHYQLEPKAQTKLVRVVTGAIFDVVVDIRKNSSTFGRWEGFILSESNKRQLLVPKGFAHGFCTLVDQTQVLYKVDEYYSADHDRGILWSDSELGIAWPTQNPILSEKDQYHPKLSESEINFTY